MKPDPRRRGGARGARAPVPGAEPSLLAAERKRAERQEQNRRKHRLLRLGQVLMAAGVVVGAVHVLAHMHVFGGPPTGLADLLVGYPMGGLLFIGGAILAGQ